MYKTKRALIASAAACALFAGNAYAQAPAASGEVDAIVVTGYRASLESAVQIKKNTVGVVDAIAAEDVGKFPSTNIAEALQRIPGVAIDRNGGQGRFITIRGLGPAFNSVFMNGRQITSEGGGRAFSFDVLPAEMISGADVYKSGEPYVPSGGVGGSVNLKSLKPLENSNSIVVSVKGVHDDLSGRNKPQYFGMVTHKFLDGRLGVLGAVSIQERAYQINSTDLAWARFVPRATNAGGVLSPLATVVNPSNVATGFLAQEWRETVDYGSEKRKTYQGALQFKPIDNLTLTADGFISDFTSIARRGSLSGYQNVDRIDFIELDQRGVDIRHSQKLGGQGAFEDSSSFTYRHPKTTQYGLNATWKPFETLTVVADYSNSLTNLPLSPVALGATNVTTGFRGADAIDLRGGGIPVYTRATTQDALLNPANHFLHLNGVPGSGTIVKDTAIDEKLDFIWQPNMTGDPIIRFGIAQRSNRKMQISIGANPNTAPLFYGFVIPGPGQLPNGASFYSPFPYAMPTTGVRILQTKAKDFQDYTSSAVGLSARDRALNLAPGTSQAAFNALGGWNLRVNPNGSIVAEKIRAAYASASFGGNIGSMSYNMEFGGRYEQTETNAAGYGLQIQSIRRGSDATSYIPTYANATPALTERQHKYSNWLPAANFRLTALQDKFLPDDQLMVRLNWTKTMARPELNDIAPRLTLNLPRPNFLNGSGGNTDLRPYVSTNYDAGLEYYFGRINYLSAAYFYKNIDDFIVQNTNNVCYQITNPDNINDGAISGTNACYQITQPTNVAVAKVKGAEIAGQMGLDFLPSPFDGLGVSMNLTFVKSNAALDVSQLTQVFAIPGLSNTRNFSVFYQKGAFEGRVAYTWRDRFYEAPTGFGAEPRFVEPYDQFDAQVSFDLKELIGRDVKIVLDATNILNEKLRKSARYDDMFARLEETGSRYSLELRARF